MCVPEWEWGRVKNMCHFLTFALQWKVIGDHIYPRRYLAHSVVCLFFVRECVATDEAALWLGYAHFRLLVEGVTCGRYQFSSDRTVYAKLRYWVRLCVCVCVCARTCVCSVVTL
jgi:hypothetical protein